MDGLKTNRLLGSNFPDEGCLFPRDLKGSHPGEVKEDCAKVGFLNGDRHVEEVRLGKCCPGFREGLRDSGSCTVSEEGCPSLKEDCPVVNFSEEGCDIEEPEGCFDNSCPGNEVS
jgi:hypothetical protein